MANLETLELTISANAESASRGLQNLINSLSALSRGVGRSVGGLKRLNTELATLKGYGSMRIPSIASANTANGVKATTKAITQQTDAIKKQGLTISHFRDNVIWDEKKQREMNPQWFVDYDSPEGKRRIAEAARLREKRGNKEPIALDESTLEPFKNIKKEAQEAKESVPLIDRLRKGFNNFKEGSKNLGKELKSILPKFTALHRIMRIASTMMIRMGVRALFNGMKEGLSNYYQYSKNTGGAFAQVADQLSSTWATLKNQMGATIAPALSAAIPVLNAIASAALTAFNALSQLFALLTGKGSWSKATAQVNAFDSAAKKAGGGGGGVNELLAKFDELNVIASESGGGGGAAAAAEDFANMFEEMYDFDSKIRDIANFIKETISWVKDNFDILLATAGLIGVAILGWKLSKAFEGFMSTLGSWIAGGALIAVGVVLDYDFGYKAGSALNGGENLKFGDIVEGIAGIIAAGIGGFVIGGGVGATVGIGIAITASIAGIYMGYLDQQDKNKWGKVELSSDEIKNYIESKFKFKVYAEAKIMDTEVNVTRMAKAHLEAQIRAFSSSIAKIKIGVDNSQAGIDDAIDSAKKVISALKEYLDSSKNLISEMFKINPDYVSKQIKKDIDAADKNIMDYVKGEGEKIANLYDQGMKNEWKGNEQEQIYALLSHLEAIFQAAEADQAYVNFISSSRLRLKDMTKQTAKTILEEQQKALDAYNKTLSDATQEAVQSLLYRAKLAEEAGMPEVANSLRADAQILVNTFKTESAKKLNEAKESMKQDWISQLNEVYGMDYTSRTNEYANQFVSGLRTSFEINKEEGKKRIIEYLDYITDVGITKDAKDVFGITGWDLLERDAKLKFFTVVYQAVGVDAVNALKDALKLSASELFSISWTGFETKQKLEFYNAVKNAYGSSNALKAAKDAGIDIGNAVKEGLASTDSSTRQSAEQIVKDIQAQLDKLGIKINASAEFEVAITALIEYEVKENIKPGTNTKSVKASSTSSSLKPNKTNISMTKATGAFGIPAGDVFIANEQGAELVGSINGKTSVANQEQIIEGIQRGVSEANSEQNALLRQQNELLRGILEKENIVRFGASPALGRTVRQSLNMYSNVTGG